jgi:hypothetical protein
VRWSGVLLLLGLLVLDRSLWTSRVGGIDSNGMRKRRHVTWGNLAFRPR